jgi:hypothetical protein
MIRAEVAAINLGLKLSHPGLLFDSACSLILIQKYIRSPNTMRQHPHGKVPSSVISTLRTRTAARITTHIGKIKAHINSMGNIHADHLANIVADGQPPDAIYFRGALTHLGHWTWPYTNQHNEPPPLKTLLYTNLKTNTRKYSLASTITPLHHNTKHGDLLATAKKIGADFSYHGRHPSLTSTKFTHNRKFMWGVHNTRLLPWNDTLKVQM